MSKNDQPQADESLQRDFNLFSAVLDATSSGVIITDNQQPDNPIIYCNRAFEVLTGYKRNEIIGHNCRFLQGVDRHQDARETLAKAVQKGDGCQVEIKNYRKDGTLFWNELVVSPVRDSEGKVTHFIGVQLDASRRKKAEADLQKERENLEKRIEERTQKLRNSQEYLESIFQTVRESLIVLDPDLKVISANNFFYRTFNTTSHETEGKYLFDLGNGQWNIPELRDLLEHILPANNPFESFEVEHEFPAIGKRLMILNARQVELEGEYKDRILLAIEDYTDRRENERRKDDFLSVASHELKTPLTSIKGYIQVLERILGGQINDKAKELFNKTQTYINRLTNLINDLLDVSKIQAGKINFKFVNFDFDAMIHEGVDSVLTTLDHHEVKITGETGLQVHGDRERLEQVLTNLLTNAIKYSPNGSEIDIHISRVSDFLKVSVADRGMGINDQDQKKIFDRFYRAENVQNSFPGMGIGLYVCDQIVRRHGGTLWVDSEVDKGSTFSFTVPLKQND